MKKLLTFLCCSFLMIFLTSCGDSSDSTSVDAAGKHNEDLLKSTGKPERAGWFVAEGASSNLFMAEAGRLASSKGADPRVKEYGQLLLDHHTQLNTQLKQIADLKNMITPTSMSDSHQKRYNKILEKSGAEFDKAFLEEMVKEHEKIMEKFQDFIEEGGDEELRNYAQQAVPTVRAHMARANSLESELK